MVRCREIKVLNFTQDQHSSLHIGARGVIFRFGAVKSENKFPLFGHNSILLSMMLSRFKKYISHCANIHMIFGTEKKSTAITTTFHGNNGNIGRVQHFDQKSSNNSSSDGERYKSPVGWRILSLEFDKCAIANIQVYISKLSYDTHKSNKHSCMHKVLAEPKIVQQ